MYRVLWFLGVSVLALLAMGVLVLASAGGVSGLDIYHDSYHFLTRQCGFLLIGLVALFAAARFDYHKWREFPWLTVLFYLGVVGLMAAVFLFPNVKGSRRWIPLGPVRLQPSELGKLAVVIAMSVFLDRAGWRVSKFWTGACRAVLIVAVLMGLALGEPDFGAAVVMGGTAAVLLLISGMKFSHMCALGGAGLMGVGFLLYHNQNRMNRILSWLKGWFGQAMSDGTMVVLSDKEKAAEYQAQNALIAIQNGGITGVGFNQSTQKLAYLPEAHTDFIFAIGAEEWGLIFSLALVALYLTIFACGLIIAARSPDRLGRLIAYGMTFLIVFPAFFNLGVVTKCLPTKGIALPFISYGGSHIISALFAIGTLFNVGRQIELPKLRPRVTISPVFQTQGV